MHWRMHSETLVVGKLLQKRYYSHIIFYDYAYSKGPWTQIIGPLRANTIILSEFRP